MPRPSVFEFEPALESLSRRFDRFAKSPIFRFLVLFAFLDDLGITSDRVFKTEFLTDPHRLQQ